MSNNKCELMFPNLEAEQARRDMVDEDVAKLIGIKRNTYTAKKSSGAFKFSELKQLCDVFGATFEYLFEKGKEA